jgi:flagellar basal body-associated protein FliL
MYKVQVTPLIGLPRFDGWAHVTTITSGTIVFALSVDGQHARNIGRDLVDVINQHDGIHTGAELYKLVATLVQDAQDKEGVVSVSAALLKKEEKSTFCVFNGSISLKRDSKSGLLLQSEQQLQVIEGRAQPEDVYIFATQQAGQFLEEVKQKFDQGFEADTIVTSITPSLHLEETTATSAMAFVDFGLHFPKHSKHSEHSEAGEVPTEELPTLVEEAVAVEVVEVEASGLDGAEDWLALSDEKPVKMMHSQPNQKQQSRIDIRQLQLLQQQAVSFLGKVANSVSNMGGVFQRVLAWRPAASGEVYVGQAATKKRIRIGIVVGIVAVAIAGGVGFYFYQRSQKIALASEVLAPFIEDIQQVKNEIENNPIQAREKLQSIIQEMEAVEASLQENQVVQNRVTLSLEDARKLYDEVSGKEVFSDLAIFFSSRDQETDILITDSALVDDQFLFFDTQKKEGVLVTREGVKQASFSAEIDGEIKDVSVEVGLDTLWLLSNQVFATQPTENQSPSEKITDEERLPDGSIIAAFSNSLYIFNAEERTIFKYAAGEDGFADPTRWIRSVPGLDFEQIVDMMIDGDIWLSSNTGEIFRLRSGNRQDFSFTGLEKPFTSSVFMYSQEEFSNFYFLEPSESRVVITDKDGVFVREVTSSSLAAASHIIVNNDETKLLAISGSTVYQIEL